MNDELKELNRRLELDAVEAQNDGDIEMINGLKVAMWEVSHLDKPFNFYREGTNDNG